MKSVNLLPPERRRGGRKRSSSGGVLRQPLLAAAVGLAVVSAAALGLMLRSASSDVSAKRSELASLQAGLARLQKPAQPKVSSADAAAATARLRAVTAVGAARVSWDDLLGAVSRVLPENVWLDSMSLAATPSATPPPVGTPVPAGTAPTSGFTISGYTYSHPSVARLMRRLELVPWLANVSLVSSDRTQVGQSTVFKFTVGAGVQNVEVHP